MTVSRTTFSALLAYDAAGNRLAKTDAGGTVSYTLGVGDRLASWTGGSYSHDTAGCVTRIVRGGDTLNLAWNGQYQLVSVSTNGAFAESYAYDALGRRVSTTTREGTVRHVYDGVQCIADIDGNGDVVASYTWGAGIDNLLAIRTGGATYYPLTDVQGTIWGYVDSSNSIVARFEYDAWGNILSTTSSVTALARNRYRFQCREWSAATGLVNFRARWYDPVTGRWLSKDPIGLSGGLNLYAFCDGNPVNYVDPSGTIIPAPLLSGLLGALGGGIVGGSLTFHNGGSFWAGFVGGAISGAITGATMGAIPFAVPGVLVGSGINAVSGAIGSVVEQKLNGQNINWHQVGSSALIGGITGVVGGVGGSVGMASKEYWVKVAFGADAAIYTTLAIWENNQCE